MGIRKQKEAPYQHEVFDDDDGTIVECLHTEEEAKTKQAEHLERVKARKVERGGQKAERLIDRAEKIAEKIKDTKDASK